MKQRLQVMKLGIQSTPRSQLVNWTNLVKLLAVEINLL